MEIMFLINKEVLIAKLKEWKTFFIEIKITNKIVFDTIDDQKRLVKLSITQKPIDNKANKQIIDIFKNLGLRINIKSGLTSKFKKVEVIN